MKISDVFDDPTEFNRALERGQIMTNTPQEDEELRHFIVELRKERSSHLIDESDYIDRLMARIKAHAEKAALEARKKGDHEGYVRAINNFSGWYMDASNPVQRQPMLADIARDLIDIYKHPVYVADELQSQPNNQDKETL